jgi:hypothetical protein
MKEQPSFVKKGEPIKASEYNRIVDTVRRLTPQGLSINSVKKSRSRAFDVLDTKFENSKWYIRLKAGFVIDGVASHYVYYQDDNDDNWPIGGIDYDTDTYTAKQIYGFKFPWIEVIPDNLLCVNLEDNKLKWILYNEPYATCIPISDFTISDTGLKIRNLSPNNVVKSADHGLKVNVWQKVESPLEPDPDACDVTVSAGWVFNIRTFSGEDSVYKLMPDDGADPAVKLDATPPPVFTDVAIDKVIYVYVETDEKGRMIEDPQVLVDDDEKESVHYQPDPVQSNGEMYFPLAKIKKHEYTNAIVGDFHTYYADQYIFGQIQLGADLITIKNIGEKREWFDTVITESSEYNFRTAEQLMGGNGVAIIKPLSSATPATSSTPGTPAEEEGDTIKWRYIIERATQPQINISVTDDGNGVRIQGNDYTNYFGGVVKALNVSDGLVTSFQEASGWSGDIQLDFVDNVNASNDTYLFITVENGLITVVNDNGVNVPDGGTATFSTNNTA